MAFAVDKNNDGFDAPDDFQMSTKIMVFGVGGAGGNAVEHMVNIGVNDVDYVVANTDVAALRSKDGSKMSRIQIGRKTTGGRGAGNDPSRGKVSAEENKDDIAEKLEGVSMLFVTAGMGGGTGTGAAPVVASVAKEKEILTVGVVTKPFNFEGTSKMNQALAGIAEMKKYVDALIVIPNERLKQFKGTKLSLKEAFAAVDDILCKAVMGVIQLLQGTGYLNVDFSDIKMALKNSGIAHMAIGSGRGDNRLDDAINEVLHSPLLETSIDGARRGLICVNIPETFLLDDFDSIMENITNKFNSEANYKIGFVFDPELDDEEISIIAIATDFVEDEPEVDDDDDIHSMPSVTVNPNNDGTSGSIGFNSDPSINMDELLEKFNHNRNF